jgi:NAD(P)-dependent dehydrogenase (short-subunit alcohol dehydrogenase family)
MRTLGSRSTAAEVVAGVDLSGRRAVVTGAGSGIGVETARALADAGAEVTMAVRDPAAADRVAVDLRSTAQGPVRVATLDLGDRRSVEAFADAWRGPLHVLVCNAGVTYPDLRRDAEGRELQFAINHLGHSLLARRLRPALAAGAPARIVVVSSSAHLRSPVVFDDLHFDFRAYSRPLGYGQSKAANVLFAVGATARWQGDGILANAAMPGVIDTNIQRHLDPGFLAATLARTDIPEPKTPAQGAATSVYLAASPLAEGVGGRYFEDCAEAEVVSRRTRSAGVAPYVLDRDNADRLWRVSDLLAP